jgi:hypothetical protein
MDNTRTTEQTKITPDVALTAIVQCNYGATPATILVPGLAPLFGLMPLAMEAVASQHPHLAGKPIVGLRYEIEARARR